MRCSASVFASQVQKGCSFLLCNAGAKVPNSKRCTLSVPMLQRQAAEPTHFLALPDDVFGLIYASLVWDRESKAAMHHTCRALYRSPSINDQNQTLILEQAAKTDKFAKLKAFPKNATLRYLRLWDGSAMTCLSASVQGHLCDVERLEVRVSVLHSDSWTSACLYWQVLGPGIGKEFMDWEVFASSKRVQFF